MIQLRTQTPAYWGSEFTLNESDTEQIYNHFLEVVKPQSVKQIARVIIASRIREETNRMKKQLAGREVYLPKENYEVGTKLVFPAMKFAQGEVTAVRTGNNPQYGKFDVIAVKLNRKTREFATGLTDDHPLNRMDAEALIAAATSDVDDLVEKYGDLVIDKVSKLLANNKEFIKLSGVWFVKALMPEINIGHLHLAEAILEMYEGGPLTVAEIVPHLDLDSSVDAEVQQFSLNYHMSNDERFDEVAPLGQIGWFLTRMEPDGVLETPERLEYTPVAYDRALISPLLGQLEYELDDEWSNIPDRLTADNEVTFTLTYPHRWAGTIPFSSRIRPLFPASNSPRQRVIFIDEQNNNEEIVGWIVSEKRYIFGLGEWYKKLGMPVGGFIHLKPGPKPGVLLLGYDHRRTKKEWVRLATVQDNRIKFSLERREIGCGYDDLMNVGTDVVAAIDALWRRAETNDRPVASLLAEIFPELTDEMNPQKTVHAKTLYSALNMLKRVTPGLMFAELVRHPAFQAVGDNYWMFDSSRWQKKR